MWLKINKDWEISYMKTILLDIFNKTTRIIFHQNCNIVNIDVHDINDSKQEVSNIVVKKNSYTFFEFYWQDFKYADILLCVINWRVLSIIYLSVNDNNTPIVLIFIITAYLILPYKYETLIINEIHTSLLTYSLSSLFPLFYNFFFIQIFIF